MCGDIDGLYVMAGSGSTLAIVLDVRDSKPHIEFLT